MDGVEVYRWFLTASPFELRIVYFNSQLVDFTSQIVMRSRINYALEGESQAGQRIVMANLDMSVYVYITLQFFLS